MTENPETVFAGFVDWLIGREVKAAGLFLNSLRVSIDGGFATDTGMFLWFEPSWQLGGPSGILVGSMQAQVEDPDAHNALDLLVQDLLGRQVERVSIEQLTNDIDVRFSGGLWIGTFVSDPTHDENWYFRDRRNNLVITGSPQGLRVEERLTPTSRPGER